MAFPATDTPTHRELLSQAAIHIAARERQRDPHLSITGARRILADELGVTLQAVKLMHYRNRVSEDHWATIERVTDGVITRQHFQAASHGPEAG